MSAERLLHAQRGPHGPLGVVLVGDRRTEQGDDGVADDLVDPAAEGVDVGHEPLEAVVDQVLHLLGVAGLGQRREADEVGEQDRDDPTLVAPAAAGPARTRGRTVRPPGTSASGSWGRSPDAESTGAARPTLTPGTRTARPGQGQGEPRMSASVGAADSGPPA